MNNIFGRFFLTWLFYVLGFLGDQWWEHRLDSAPQDWGLTAVVAVLSGAVVSGLLHCLLTLGWIEREMKQRTGAGASNRRAA